MVVLCVVFVVDNMLVGEGKIVVDMIFNLMNDFLFGEIVCKIELFVKLFEVCM